MIRDILTNLGFEIALVLFIILCACGAAVCLWDNTKVKRGPP